jgi:hypothetical protein
MNFFRADVLQFYRAENPLLRNLSLGFKVLKKGSRMAVFIGKGGLSGSKTGQKEGFVVTYW